jgi:hypothetical protein
MLWLFSLPLDFLAVPFFFCSVLFPTVLGIEPEALNLLAKQEHYHLSHAPTFHSHLIAYQE